MNALKLEVIVVGKKLLVESNIHRGVELAGLKENSFSFT